MKDTGAYLGDGLYASFDGYQIRLYAWNGIHATNEVFLEPEVIAAFLQYLETLKGDATRARHKGNSNQDRR